MVSSFVSRSVRPVVVHAARVAVLAGIAVLIHAEHLRRVAVATSADLAEVPLERIRRHLPAAEAIGGAARLVDGGREVVDAAGQAVGTILRTSPAGDTAIGFSGPTDVLVVCDADLRVAGMELLASRDTRDHVRAVDRDEAFWRSFVGRPLDSLAIPDAAGAHAVAGATLTSLAIREAIVRRLGGTAAAGRFAREPTLDDLRTIFPDAREIAVDPGDPAVIRVRGPEGIPLGWALRTSPAADGVIGYQGPTDAVVGFDPQSRVCGIAVLESYDNEPYVGYVRDDRAFRGVFRGMSPEELAGLDADRTGVEGVSGATMTSQAVAAGIVRAARARSAVLRRADAAGLVGILRRIEGPQWGGLGVIAAGVITAFTRLRGGWFGRIALPIVVLAYLGFGAGAVLSQAQAWGWAQAGVPQGAVMLLALAAVAVVFPVVTRRNVYCGHLCAHGAAQQLFVRFGWPRRSVPDRLRLPLVGLPWLLVVVAIIVSLLHLPVALVDLEPFDAYLPAVAGTAAVVLFVVSLLASCRVPMAYCRHGCPTGALLDHLRFNRRADRITWRDMVLVGCLACAAAVHWWPR